jgi:hypothetical protein
MAYLDRLHAQRKEPAPDIFSEAYWDEWRKRLEPK